MNIAVANRPRDELRILDDSSLRAAGHPEDVTTDGPAISRGNRKPPGAKAIPRAAELKPYNPKQRYLISR